MFYFGFKSSFSISTSWAGMIWAALWQMNLEFLEMKMLIISKRRHELFSFSIFVKLNTHT